jgi:type II secretory pathway pseudopilin PulG
MNHADAAPRRGDGQGGFTLLEIMVGVAILIGGVLGLTASMVAAYRVQRGTDERKIALAFATLHLERMRGMTYAEILEAPDESGLGGYLVDATWSSAEEVGEGTEEKFLRYYYSDPTKADYKTDGGKFIDLYDEMLLGLTNQSGQTRCAEIMFREDSGETGATAGRGMWITIRVFWKGATGDSELKIATYRST